MVWGAFLHYLWLDREIDIDVRSSRRRGCMRQRLDQRKDRSMRRGQRCRSNWSRRAGARPVCGPFEREEAVDRAAAVPPSRSKCIIVYNDRKVRERLCDGCQKVTSAQRHDLNLHVEKTITLNDAFPVEHRVNTFVQHARQSSRSRSTRTRSA